jgi:hypothetical protein
MCYQRLRELERIFADRYGSRLPDNDAGRDVLFIAAHHIAQADEPEDTRRANIRSWSLLWCPWLDEEECAALVARVIAKPIRWGAKTLGWRLRLMDADRTRLAVTTIAPIDCTKAARAKRSEQRHNAKKREDRKNTRAGRPVPVSRSKPWESEGISRATWYRRRKNEPVRQNPAKADRNTIIASADTSLRPAKPPTPRPDRAPIQSFTGRARKKLGR